jgi:cytochrome P450
MDFLLEEQARLGDIFMLNAGFLDIIILAHPRHAQHVLRDHGRKYDKGGPLWRALRSIAGDGLATTNNWDFWLRQRRMIQPHFHRTRLEQLTSIMVKAIDEVFSELPSLAQTGQVVDFNHYISRTTMTVTIQTLFSTVLSTEEANRLERAAFPALNHTMPATLIDSLPQWMPKPRIRKFHKNMAIIDDLVYEVLRRCRQTIGDSPGLMGMLLDMVDDETTEQMTDAQLRDEAVTMLLAGFETTAGAIGWTIHFLTYNLDVMRQAQDEISSVLGSRIPGFSDLPKLQYTYRVIQEALRLRPPGFWVPRHSAVEDEIDGYHIPAGKVILVMAQLIHNHIDVWDEPSKFDPDRFLPEIAAKRDPFAWIPFGMGQRQCIGRDFAMMESQLVIARLLQNYDVRAVEGHVVKSHFNATQRPHRLLISLRQRH